MSEAIDVLILDFVEWIAKERRSYEDVMDAWQTSCPRLAVWEEAIDRGLVRRETESPRGAFVVVTPSGQKFLERKAI